MPADDAPKWSRGLPLPRDATSPSRARSFVRAELSAQGLPDLVDDVELVVSELVTNAVLHAGTALVVTLSEDGARVLLTVRDHTPRFGPLVRTVTPSDTQGRGLMITEMISDDWGVEIASTSAKSVWASFSTVEGA